VTTYAFVAAERANHAVATLCRVVGASVSGFYAWLRAIPSRQNRAEADAALRGHISRIFVAKRRVYGAPRIHAELRREGHRHARRRIERLMRDMGLQASRGQRRKPQTTTSRHDQPPRPAATTSRHDQPPRPAATTSRSRPIGSAAPLWPSVPMPCGWPTSPTFQPTRAFCPWPPKDLATRQIVGWSMAEHLKAGLCIDALVMALQRCRPPRGLIHHSDRGVQGGFKWSSQQGLFWLIAATGQAPRRAFAS
jgi:putative transposase